MNSLLLVLIRYNIETLADSDNRVASNKLSEMRSPKFANTGLDRSLHLPKRE